MTTRAEVGRSEINQRLMAIVKEKGLTQADLVRASGATSPAVTDWFNRGAVPDAERLARIAQAIRVNGHWLLTGKGPKTLPGDGTKDLDQAYTQGAQAVVADLGKILRQFEEHYSESAGVTTAKGLARAGGRRAR